MFKVPRLRMKREAGENPVRSRHCEPRVPFSNPLDNIGKGRGMMIGSQETCLDNSLNLRAIGVMCFSEYPNKDIKEPLRLFFYLPPISERVLVELEFYSGECQLRRCRLGQRR